MSTTAYEKISDDELDAIVGGRLVLPIVNMKLLTIQSA
ncbi:MAG TPA: bacteriocin [Mycobacteriales bacterium]|nr:bacteriocin [Mycobacteriales bacterium]